MEIKYGSIEYFALLNLQDRLKLWSYDKLNLVYLDKLRAEIDMKMKAINFEYTEQIKKSNGS